MKTADLAGASVPAAEPRVPRPIGPIWSVLVLVLIALAAALLAGGFTAMFLHLTEPGGLAALGEQIEQAGKSADFLPGAERSGWLFMLLLEVFVALFVIGIAAIRAGRQFPALIAAMGGIPPKPLKIGCAVLVAYMLALISVEVLHPPFGEWMRQALRLPQDTTALWMSAFLIVLVAPICEEVVFRGFLYSAFRAKWGFAVSLSVTSALFVAVHYQTEWRYTLFVIPCALILGWAREASGGIALPILLHMTNNLVAFVSLLYFMEAMV